MVNQSKYFKSFVLMEGDPITTTYDPVSDSRRKCQSLLEVLESESIRPNTVHKGLAKRLCASYLTDGYSGTYRPEGLVFSTDAKPDYCVPFDLLALAKGTHYSDEFLEGHERFKFRSIDEMLAEYGNSKKALQSLNELRIRNGLEAVDMNYNECCFEKDVALKPVALIGQSQPYKELALKFEIPRFDTINDYQQSQKKSLLDFTRKSIVGAAFRVGASFAIDASLYMTVTGFDMDKFFERFQWDKFAMVTAAVVAINFVDYRFDVTDKLDRIAKKLTRT